MALILNRRVSAIGYYSEWLIPGRPPFLRSESYRMLKAELRRYVEQGVPGRAFLISGHRGAGKTTLVHRAVEDLGDELIAEWWNRLPETLLLESRPQRPLLVKLHGPSLMAESLPGERKPESAETPKPAEPDGAEKPEQPQKVQITVETKGTKAEAGEKSVKPPSAAQVALVQITIALYRALAKECADNFATHAKRLEFSGLKEFAAQLRLDLDQAPSPGLLRGYWDRLWGEPEFGLAHGVAWPTLIVQRFREWGIGDQGAREIVALATAAQAFQVCSGVVTYQRKLKSAAAFERSAETKAGIDPADALNRLLGLGIGGLLGFGAASLAGVPAAAGVGLGLLGSLAVSTTVKRSNRQERNDDYTFLVDTSPETLERDLPLVIERVRQAGFAPVFLIDELDKLEPEEGDEAQGRKPGTRRTVGGLIRQLKHLTTDFGFFCFLTDPQYFNSVQQRLEADAYSEEHTYFSHRLFVLHTPEDLFAYLLEMIRSDGHPLQAIDDASARPVLAKVIVHESRLNMIAVSRALVDGWDRGPYRTASSQIKFSPRNQLIVLVQLGVEHMLRRHDLADRLHRSPALRQLAIDALYFISERWRRSRTEPDIDLSDEALARALLAHHERERDDHKRLQEKIGAKQAGLGPAVRDLADLLCNFSMLSLALALEAEAAPEVIVADEREARELLASPPGPGLLEKVGEERYRFLFDDEGQAIARPVVLPLTSVGVSRAGAEAATSWWEPRPEPRTAPAMPQPVVAPSTDPHTPEAVAFDAVSRLLHVAEQFEVDLDVLVALRLLPRWVSQRELRRLVTTFRRWSEEDLHRLAELTRVLQDTGSALVRALILARQAASASGATTRSGLEAASRFVDLRQRTASATLINAPPADTFDYGAWLAGVADGPAEDWLARSKSEKRTEEGLRRLQLRSFARWKGPIESFLAEGKRSAPTAHFEDVVLAAAGRLPSRALRGSFDEMTALEWSDLALAPMPVPFLTPDYWPLLAGLLQLGFGNPFVGMVGEWLVNKGLLQPGGLLDVAGRAPLTQAGVLAVLLDESEYRLARETGPYLLARGLGPPGEDLAPARPSWDQNIQSFVGGNLLLAVLRDMGGFRMVIEEFGSVGTGVDGLAKWQAFTPKEIVYLGFSRTGAPSPEVSELPAFRFNVSSLEEVVAYGDRLIRHMARPPSAPAKS